MDANNNNTALPRHQLDEARRLMAMTHVVVTVPIISGEQRQPTVDQQQQHVMYTNNRQG